MITALDVAKYFLRLSDVENAGDTFSHQHLQKLVYYAQGVHWAITGKRLLDENIETWDHSPVSLSLYQSLKQFGDKSVDVDLTDFDVGIFTKAQQALLEHVYLTYGRYSAFVLRDMTRSSCAKPNGCSIEDHALIDHFKGGMVEFYPPNVEDMLWAKSA
jgi:uncharacterized phage-associated protein